MAGRTEVTRTLHARPRRHMPLHPRKRGFPALSERRCHRPRSRSRLARGTQRAAGSAARIDVRHERGEGRGPGAEPRSPSDVRAVSHASHRFFFILRQRDSLAGRKPGTHHNGRRRRPLCRTSRPAPSDRGSEPAFQLQTLQSSLLLRPGREVQQKRPAIRLRGVASMIGRGQYPGDGVTGATQPARSTRWNQPDGRSRTGPSSGGLSGAAGGLGS